MTIIASAPVPAASRVDQADTVSLPVIPTSAEYWAARLADPGDSPEIAALVAEYAHRYAEIVAGTTVQAEPTPATPACPAWCFDHYSDADDGAELHNGETTIIKTGQGAEGTDIGVKLHRLDVAGEAPELTVHLRAGDQDLTPEEALRLAAVLVRHAQKLTGQAEPGAGHEYDAAYEAYARSRYWQGYNDAMQDTCEAYGVGQ